MNSPEFGYLPRPFARMHLPMTNPGDLKRYTRRDGRYRVHYIASGKYALPYGGDLLTVYGICTKAREAIRFQGKEWDGIIRFQSVAELLRCFGEPKSTPYYRRRMESLLRVFGCQVHLEESLRRNGVATEMEIKKIDFMYRIKAWFQCEASQLGLPLPSEIEFGQHMIDIIRTSPRAMFGSSCIPAFNHSAVTSLKKSIGALQLYFLLSDWYTVSSQAADQKGTSYGFIPIHGPSSLESQLGWLKVPEKREVRRKLTTWLTEIKTIAWPSLSWEMVQGGDENWRLLIHFCGKPVENVQ